MSPTLHVFTARFNPLRWRAPQRHFVDWAQDMASIGADVTVIECAYGETPFACEMPGIVTHIGVRAELVGLDEGMPLEPRHRPPAGGEVHLLG